MNLADMLYHQTGAFHGRSLGSEWGRVEDNEDPRGLGRVRVKLAWHKEGEATDWIARQGGGGGGYGETGSIPQIGELVLVVFDRGDAQRMTYRAGTWTEGGIGTSGKIPPSLPPHKRDETLKAQPNHQPEKGKFKVWYEKSLSGWLKWVGEGLDWMRWRSPKGYQLDIEHDVPVGGMNKDAAKSSLPYHHLGLSTPTGHLIEVLEWPPENRNEVRVQHSGGMRFELLQGAGGLTGRLSVDGHVFELTTEGGGKATLSTAGGQRIVANDAAGTVDVKANTKVTVNGTTQAEIKAVQVSVNSTTTTISALTAITLAAPAVIVTSPVITMAAGAMGLGIDSAGAVMTASSVKLGGGAAMQGVARLGDQVTVTGTDSRGDTFTATGTITSASSVVRAL